MFNVNNKLMSSDDRTLIWKIDSFEFCDDRKLNLNRFFWEISKLKFFKG